MTQGCALRMGGLRVRVESSSAALMAKLAAYFACFHDPAVEARAEPAFTVTALECAPPDLGLCFRGWPRGPGKAGDKEELADIAGGRVVRDLRTGVQYLCGGGRRVVVGPCARNDHRIAAFIASQIVGWRMDQGSSLCHAAAVVRGGAGLGISARSGAGKSTLMLHLMSRGLSFCSNDRLLIGLRRDRAEMYGEPMLPRINPGTALGNPDLGSVVSEERKAGLRALPLEDLWVLEEKYDVRVDRIYGPGRVQLAAPLAGLLLLSWDRKADQPVRFERVNPRVRPDLLDRVKKPPGPLHLSGRAPWVVASNPMDSEPYLRVLDRVPVYEATGRTSFDAAVRFVLDRLLPTSAP